jgi:hypothetical protein
MNKSKYLSYRRILALVKDFLRHFLKGCDCTLRPCGGAAWKLNGLVTLKPKLIAKAYALGSIEIRFLK